MANTRELYAALSPRQRAAWLNLQRIHTSQASMDIYEQMGSVRFAQPQALFAACYNNVFDLPQGENLPDVPWQPGWDDPYFGHQEPYVYLGDFPMGAWWGYWAPGKFSGTEFTRSFKPRNSYDTGCARRRRNYTGP